MLIEFMNVITVDKKPFMEDVRLNNQPANRQLRLKLTYINGETKTPIDLVIFNWAPKIEKFNLAISIDGEERTTNTKFIIKVSYDVFKRQINVNGKVDDTDLKLSISNVKELMELPKHLASFKKVEA